MPLSTWADYIYVVENGSSEVAKYTTTGSLVNASLITGLNSPTDIKLDGRGNLFVALEGGLTPGGVSMFTTGGVPVNTSLVTNLLGVNCVAFSGTNLFVTLENTAFVSCYGLSGATVVSSNTTFITSETKYPGPIVTDGSDIYINDTFLGFLQKYTMAGAPVDQELDLGEPSGLSMAIDGTNLFVALFLNNRVAEYSTTGRIITTNLITGLNGPYGLAADGQGHLFVASYNSGTVAEYTTSGALINPSLITGLNAPVALAVEVVTVAPSLGIRQARNTVMATWTGTAGFLLQTNPDLTTPNWRVDNDVTSANGTNTAVVASPTGKLFFRLESTNSP